ncbi:MAG TPA: hypothetical protein PKD24_04485 [Pyrinomonadaceae bacterium]|nr:hypothetical protein [Pyrinomonadaceae bacterium]HMP64809.1 hypothetical protein [Pyrinomonadaceae bacterium]
MIDKAIVAKKIIDVLNQIQDAGEFQKVEITTDSCPGQELTEFDSQLWVVANTMLGEEIEDSIPDNVNIFVSEDGKSLLRVGEIAERIVRNLEKKGGKK